MTADFSSSRRRLVRWLPGLAGLAGSALPGWLVLPAQALARPHAAAGMPLALEAPPGIDPRGYLVSEKYDGVRALWDGRQLRFRGGGEVIAPAWFSAQLPACALDGELWAGRGQFESVSGTARQLKPHDAAWRALRYMVFDLPDGTGDFAQRYRQLQRLAAAGPTPGPEPGLCWQAVAQTTVADAASLARQLRAVLQLGGEGLMLRRADAPYAHGRSAAMFKLKPSDDAEALVLGHVPGRGKHAGRLGALRVRTPEGIEFKLGTGFSDAQRAAPPAIGERVSYRFQGRTDDGVPRFASFLRVRPDGV